MLELIISILIMLVSYTVLLTTMRHAWVPIKLSLVLVSISSAVNCITHMKLVSTGYSLPNTPDQFSHLAFLFSILLLLSTILLKRCVCQDNNGNSFIKKPEDMPLQS